MHGVTAGWAKGRNGTEELVPACLQDQVPLELCTYLSGLQRGFQNFLRKAELKLNSGPSPGRWYMLGVETPSLAPLWVWF